MNIKKIIREESDDFDWIREVPRNFTIDSILGKQMYYRPNNLMELVSDYGQDYNPKLLVLGDIRYYNGWMAIEHDGVNVTLELDNGGTTLYPIKDVLTYVNVGAWVVMDESGKPMNETDDLLKKV